MPAPPRTGAELRHATYMFYFNGSHFPLTTARLDAVSGRRRFLESIRLHRRVDPEKTTRIAPPPPPACPAASSGLPARRAVNGRGRPGGGAGPLHRNSGRDAL